MNQNIDQIKEVIKQQPVEPQPEPKPEPQKEVETPEYVTRSEYEDFCGAVWDKFEKADIVPIEPNVVMADFIQRLQDVEDKVDTQDVEDLSGQMVEVELESPKGSVPIEHTQKTIMILKKMGFAIRSITPLKDE